MFEQTRREKEDRDGYYLGLDIGSVSLNTILMNQSFDVIEEYYDFTRGKPFHSLLNRLTTLFEKYPSDGIILTAITGSGGKIASELIGGDYVNEIIAQAMAVSRLYPETKTVIEIGGEDSKLILLEKEPGKEFPRLTDFEMNSICAAGTGSFLDQQARRIGVSIEKEFGELALRSTDPPRIAGRCSVFAKSDMIHLQQIATPLHDIVAGLCFALARNFRSTIARSKEMRTPVVFSGGVAANAGMIRAFRETLALGEDEFLIPEHHASMGAIGAILHTFSESGSAGFRGLDNLKDYLLNGGSNTKGLPRLVNSDAMIRKSGLYEFNGQPRIPVYLGLDIGSLSTNLVLITDDHTVVARRYLPTAGKPLEAIQRGLTEIYDEVGERVLVAGAGTTGSGRYLTGDFIGADIIVNEITAQATAAIDYDPSVDTIIEIGGQDSKFISIKDGAVVDFEMNKVCAAGTGSFLEEQAEKLNIKIVEQFGSLALACDCPVKLGDRCTVFMESDLNSFLQKGVKVDKLVGGLAYSIVSNYLQKVVGERKIGKKIFFQGGVANNKSVVSAFEQVLGTGITIPPDFDVTGAIGVAILAKKSVNETGNTKFKGFDRRNTTYEVSSFICQACTNHCEIRKVTVSGEKKALFYGGRCEKYETSDRKRLPGNIPNLFNRRLEMLTDGFVPSEKEGAITIGIPRALMIYYQQFPFWRTFFEELGFKIVLSRETDKKLVTKSLETITTETCMPVELMHGHVVDLIEQKVDYVFLPFIVDAKGKPGNPTTNCNCPWVQTHAFMVKAALRSSVAEERILTPVLHFRHFKTALPRELSRFFSERFGLQDRRIRKAILKADQVQVAFESRLVEYGKQVLNNIPKDCRPIVILGRPYNTTDPFLNLGLVEKLIGHGFMPIPLDMLDLHVNEVFGDYRSMYWPNGQRILAATKLVAQDKRLHAIYMSNFRCGPDSFLTHYVNEEMKGKPSLHLEIDEHSADAGMITRIEAFMESLKGYEAATPKTEEIFRPRSGPASPVEGRILYFPHMNDAAQAISAAARSCGIQSEVLPMQTEQDLALGRQYTSSRECFPMICTTGSFLKKLMEPGVDPAKVSFFMPDHNGPCRFGQYNHLQRVIFDKLGFEKAEIVCPSNDSSYADIAGDNAAKFRFLSWKGFVAVDFLRKLKQETKPYELIAGNTEVVYRNSLQKTIECIENGAHGLHEVLIGCLAEFKQIPMDKSHRKPVVAIIGEIFMRDNDFCNGGLISRLEQLGVETLLSPFSEWLSYSTYRYGRDSRWKKDARGFIKSKIQGIAQHMSAESILRNIINETDHEKIVPLNAMLSLCNPYVHKDYDGDPAISLGTAAYLATRGIAGVAAILPFTCMPGTLIASVSDSFRKDHNNLPWINIAYDGQDSVSLDTRLQAFVFQVKEFAHEGGRNAGIRINAPSFVKQV
jgi:predicted CoA-substrate-specific enzyme activase